MATNWAKWAVIATAVVGIPAFIGIVQNWSQIKQGYQAFYQDVFNRKIFSTTNLSDAEICTIEVSTIQSNIPTNLLAGKLSLKTGESRSFNLPFGTYQFTAKDCNQLVVDRQSNQELIEDESNPKWKIKSTWFTLPVSNKTNLSVCYLWFKLSSLPDWQDYLTQQLDPNHINPYIVNLPAGTYDVAVGDCQSEPSILWKDSEIPISAKKFSPWNITTTNTATPTPVAEQVVRDYYSYLDNQKYDQAWALLSARAKQAAFSNDFNLYINAWSTSDNFLVQIVDTPSTSEVIANITYRQNGRIVCTHQHLIFDFISDTTGNVWLIDDASVKRRC